MERKSLALALLLLCGMLTPIVAADDAGGSGDAPDDQADAWHVSAGTYSAEIDMGNDEDWYWFDSTEGITVSITFDNSLMDIDLAIYVDDAATAEDSSEGLGSSEEVETTMTGNITIWVSEWNDEIGSYTMTVTSGTIEDEKESEDDGGFIPGFEVYLTLVTLLLVSILVSRRRSKL